MLNTQYQVTSRTNDPKTAYIFSWGSLKLKLLEGPLSKLSKNKQQMGSSADKNLNLKDPCLLNPAAISM